ncbi:MAG: thiol-disulfide oxidoreductase DCC family protein [Chitinophaga sp.]|uniref:thiol-disulfide oxidoreductase DCC family protein n=1 Tax=Chitinophaga sp. TaxID=1869181 RepID=UPI0025C28474|nr:thiol-disulfide oxidoreductase DCC family protein [Chitinophaga sp.]MBV8251182.1 thiol-disulfide oxidoreductase DCC family protein [Chitinophaga sp.]
MKDNGIILFDGVCNFCNASVNFVIRHDRQGYFRFAPLQSAIAADLSQQYGFDTSAQSSFILVENGKVYTKSTAALRVAKKLNFPVRLLYIFMIVPAFIRNGVYSWIARNRYRWFGKKDACMVPTPDIRSRFMI